MAFTPDERVRLRHMLGYPNVSAVASFSLGLPAAFQTIFQIESAMTKVLPEAEAKARLLLARCETLEQQLFDDAELLAVKGVGSIQINEEEMGRLKVEYKFHVNALANLFGVIPNPFDFRFTLGSSLNISVR